MDNPQFLPAIPLVLGAVFAFVGGRELRTLAWLRRHGVRVPGVVTGRRSGGGRSGTTMAVFAFTTLDGAEITTTQRMSVSFGGMRTGRRVTVAYDPENPRRAEILEASSQRIGAGVFLIAGLIAFTLGAVFAVSVWL
jgi:hypothetical protein